MDEEEEVEEEPHVTQQLAVAAVHGLVHGPVLADMIFSQSLPLLTFSHCGSFCYLWLFWKRADVHVSCDRDTP